MSKKILLSFYFTLFAFIIIAQTNSIHGFYDDHVDEQLSIEKQFDQKLSAENIGILIKKLSENPHAIGSAAAKKIQNISFVCSGNGDGRQK